MQSANRIATSVVPSLAVLGGTLLVLSVLQAVLDGEPIGSDVAESAVPVLLSLAIVYVDYRLRRRGFDAEDRASAALFALGGTVGLLVLAAWLNVIQYLDGEPFGEPSLILVGAAAVGGFAGTIAGTTQARQRRALRAAERQSERLEEFAETLTHDLRNPLNVARASLIDLEATGVEHERLGRAVDALERLEGIIEGTLAIAKEGSVVIDPEPVDLDAVARNAWSSVEAGTATLSIDDGAGTVVADESRLRRLLENLFRNAIEHGGDDVNVRVGRLDSDGPDAGFFVEDDGPGIPEEERADVFARGYSTGEGTGLGLAIVDAIADAHGWEVTATAEASGGTRIEVREVTGVE